MPEITIIHIALLATALILGLVVGWIFRARRGETEKMAINAGWQEQFEAQRNEHDRLVEQNRLLMEQNSQYQASNKDSKMRAAELSASLKEAFERRDALQRQIKDIRGNLEAAVEERNQLQSDIAHRDAEVDVTSVALKQRDDRIARLNKELANWQERVPPLIERFRVRNEEAQQLEEALAAARDRIAALEDMVGSEQTRVEPLDRSALGDDLYASNEPLDAPDDEAADDDASGFDEDDAPGLNEALGGGAGDETRDAAAPEYAEDAAPGPDEPQLADAGEEAVDDASEPDEPIAAGEGGACSTGDESQHDPADTLPDDATVIGEDMDDAAPDDGADHDDTAHAASSDFDADDLADNDSWESDDGVGTEDTESAAVYSFPAAADARERDDLKLIKGIGPAIEKTLNEMGIWRFHQIAEMSEYEIDRIARRLKGFRSRIYREDWIGQARDLDQRKTADQH